MPTHYRAVKPNRRCMKRIEQRLLPSELDRMRDLLVNRKDLAVSDIARQGWMQADGECVRIGEKGLRNLAHRLGWPSIRRADISEAARERCNAANVAARIENLLHADSVEQIRQLYVRNNTSAHRISLMSFRSHDGREMNVSPAAIISMARRLGWRGGGATPPPSAFRKEPAPQRPRLAVRGRIYKLRECGLTAQEIRQELLARGERITLAQVETVYTETNW